MSRALALVHGAGVAALLVGAWPAAPRIEAQVAHRIHGPQYASGRLWAPATRMTVAIADRPPSRAGEVQAVVWGIVAGAVDSAAREDAMRLPSVPVWKGKVAGAEFGLDGPWLVVAGARIPAAVLGLLPVSVGAPSPEQWEDARLLADRRADIERAAVRATNQDYYRAAIASIRERQELERALNEAQRLPASAAPAEGPR